MNLGDYLTIEYMVDWITRHALLAENAEIWLTIHPLPAVCQGPSRCAARLAAYSDIGLQGIAQTSSHFHPELLEEVFRFFQPELPDQLLP